MKVLHLTAHLGGGVGKALDGLVARAIDSGAGVRHAVVCLEEPAKPQFIDRIRQNGCQVTVSPALEGLEELIGETDILQLEWWNHPATIGSLCNLRSCDVRLVVWSHVSGLYNPIIPRALIGAAHVTLFTSACSLAAKEVASWPPGLRDRIGVVPSGGGFAGRPDSSAQVRQDELAMGYIG